MKNEYPALKVSSRNKLQHFYQQGTKQGMRIRHPQVPVGRWHFKTIVLTTGFLIIIFMYFNSLMPGQGVTTRRRHLVVHAAKPYKSKPFNRRRHLKIPKAAENVNLPTQTRPENSPAMKMNNSAKLDTRASLVADGLPELKGKTHMRPFNNMEGKHKQADIPTEKAPGPQDIKMDIEAPLPHQEPNPKLEKKSFPVKNTTDHQEASRSISEIADQRIPKNPDNSPSKKSENNRILSIPQGGVKRQFNSEVRDIQMPTDDRNNIQSKLNSNTFIKTDQKFGSANIGQRTYEANVKQALIPTNTSSGGQDINSKSDRHIPLPPPRKTNEAFINKKAQEVHQLVQRKNKTGSWVESIDSLPVRKVNENSLRIKSDPKNPNQWLPWENKSGNVTVDTISNSQGKSHEALLKIKSNPRNPVQRVDNKNKTVGLTEILHSFPAEKIDGTSLNINAELKNPTQYQQSNQTDNFAESKHSLSIRKTHEASLDKNSDPKYSVQWMQEKDIIPAGPVKRIHSTPIRQNNEVFLNNKLGPVNTIHRERNEGKIGHDFSERTYSFLTGNEVAVKTRAQQPNPLDAGLDTIR